MARRMILDYFYKIAEWGFYHRTRLSGHRRSLNQVSSDTADNLNWFHFLLCWEDNVRDSKHFPFTADFFVGIEACGLFN